MGTSRGSPCGGTDHDAHGVPATQPRARTRAPNLVRRLLVRSAERHLVAVLAVASDGHEANGTCRMLSRPAALGYRTGCCGDETFLDRTILNCVAP